jgi:peptidoglycan-associated lipoprotein
MKRLNLFFAIGIALLPALGACAKKPAPAPLTPPPAAATEAPAAEPQMPVVEMPVVEPVMQEPQAVSVTTTNGLKLETVYFDYDSYTLSPEARQALARNAGWLKENAGISVTIEGHCDERGSDEYNLALGERRAVAVKNYLATLGVAAARLSVVSYGEEHPAVAGHDESAWLQNRRAAFK